MWNFIRSRLTNMPHLFLGVDFAQALNPLYALPIVAVILCAFLVYAFGFKSPVQPPSFDEIEIDKKSAKKRRVKENQKSKQNGKVGGSSGKNDNILLDKKKKADKHLATEKNSVKSDTKVMKKSNAHDRKKKTNMAHDVDPVVEDGNEEGWVHHISKKGRKNRKKDDAGHIDALVLTPPSCSSVTELFNNPPENSVEEKQDVHESIHAIDISSMDEEGGDKMPVKEISLAKLKKQKKKDKKTGDKDLISEADSISADALLQEDAPIQNGLESNIDVCETIKVSREKKTTKKKKKKQTVNEKEVDSMAEKSTVNATNQNSITCNASDAILCSLEVAESSDVKDSKKKAENLIVSEGLDNVGLESGKCIDTPIEAKGSNVAFDELEGLYPDSKPSKKKKRVRRDH